MDSGADHDPAARALAAAHAGYHAETRVHRTPDASVDDVVGWATLAPHLIRARLFLVVPTLLLLVYLVLNYLRSISTPDPVNDLIVGTAGFVTIVLYVLGVAAFFAPAKEAIAEYSRLVEGAASAAPAVRERVRQAAASRRAPAEVAPSTVTGVPVLLFRQRSERAMLLVQPYGEDLYIGWTMWRSRSTMTLLAHFLRDTFGRFAPWPQFSAELRSAATRALRESVHSLAREGVAGLEAGAVAQGVREAPREHHHQPERQQNATGTGEWEAAEPYPVYRPAPPRERSAELPRPAPAADTTGAWSRRREETYETRDEGGWGPPPRERW